MIFMFVMPIILAIVITAIQNSTFELVNSNKITVLFCNKDSGEASKQLLHAIEKIGMFKINLVKATNESDQEILERMQKKDALIAVVVPGNFSAQIKSKADLVASKALKD